MSAPSRRPLGAGVIAIPALCALIASGCAGSPRQSDANTVTASTTAAALPGTPGCFWLRSFDGSWTALNQTQLLVYAPLTSPPYLVQLFEPIPTLKFAERLGFEDVEHSGQICNNTQDDAIIPNWTPHRVPITAVRRITQQEARTLMLANGLKVRPEKTGPQKAGT
jgi:hypothetical protein